MIRQARPEEADEICRLILCSFEAKVAIDYSPEGIDFFRSISKIEDCAQRLRSGNPAWVHVDEADAVDGYIELRDVHHVTRFFVAPHRMGEGIGKALHEVAQAHCRGAGLEKMTVFSSPFAVPVYARLGYVVTGPEESPHGLRYVPMEKALVALT